MNNDFVRASAFEERLREQCTDRVVPFQWGHAHYNDAVHRIYDLNALRVDRPGASVEELVREADRLQANLPHRRIVVLDPSVGVALEAEFAERGWKADRFVFMVFRGDEAPRPRVDAAVDEVDAETVAPLRARMMRETPAGDDDEVVRQLLESSALVAAAGHGRHFAALVNGTAASAADLYSDGRTAQIEDVATLPEYRGRGLATAVVVHALDEALRTGHDFVFLIADEADWPKDFYAKLGFETVGRKFAFLKPPAPGGPARTQPEGRTA